MSFSWEYGGPDSATATTATFVVPQKANPATYAITASCNGVTAAPAPFTVTRAPIVIDLGLSVTEGRPGTAVTATVTGCPDELQPAVLDWDGEPLDGSGTFTVPATASPGPHAVTATCDTARDSAEFVVTAVPQPSLTLSSDRGAPGSEFTAIGSGFDCRAGGVDIHWDEVLATAAPAGAFGVPLTVPTGAAPREYTVRAACTDDPDVADTASFTVTGAVTSQVTTTEPRVLPQNPTLTLTPASAGRGEGVTVTGGGFLCYNNSQLVTLAWDDGETLPDARTDASGSFQSRFTVPVGAGAGTRTLRASCADGAATQTASFTVVASPVTPTPTPPGTDPPPEDGSAFWLLVLILAVAIMAVWAYRRWRTPRAHPPNPRVHVESHLGGPPAVALRETPGQRSFALRLQVHAGAGNHTITEVDDDHTRS